MGGTVTDEKLLFTVAATLVAVLLFYWHISSKSRVDLQYLFVDTETQQFSIFKFGQVIALFVSTWVLIRETNHDRLNEWLYGGYMLAWAGVNIANRYISKDKPNAQPTP